MKATRPLEYICSFPMEVPTLQGDAYAFLSVDAFSGYVFSTGTELSRDAPTVLKHVRLLVQDKQFRKLNPKGFTLVFHRQPGLAGAINDIINPLGGRFIVDDLYLTSVLTPVMEHIFKAMDPKK